MRSSIVGAVWLVAALSTTAAAQSRGIEGKPAPSFGVGEWRNLPEGAARVDIDDYRGKVLYLYCFQKWCPGCHRHGFPTLKKLVEAYEGDDEVAFVTVQTVFEGFRTNTADAAWKTAAQYGLDIPVGHDGAPGRRSSIMRGYRTGGTPWTIIVDKQGVVRFNGFHVEVGAAQRLIESLRDAPDSAGDPAIGPAVGPDIETLPASRGGQDLVGTKLPRLEFDRPLNQPLHAGRTKPALTLYRWWTDRCPHCVASMPAVERLRRQYGRHGLRVIGVFHPKPSGPVGDARIREAATKVGYRGEMAVDLDWSELKRAYPDLANGKAKATSITLLVDAEGVIRFVHPGPRFFPSDDPAEARENGDYLLIERAIRALLPAGGGSGR